MLAAPVATAGTPPDVVGMRYGDESSKLDHNGYTAVVGTVVGDTLAQDDCFVASTQNTTIDAMTGQPSSKEVRVNLDCYGLASATTSGLATGDTSGEAEAVRDTIKKEEKKKRQQEQQAKSGS